MTRFRLAGTLDDAGWRFELFQKGALPFAREAPVALPDWPQAAPSHPGAALLLALLDTQEAQPEGESLHLTHDRIAGLSRPEAARLGLPPVVPLTLFMSHDAPIGEPSFALRVEWFQRSGAPVFGARRTGTGLTVAAGSFLILDPLYSALEAIDAVNAASGDASPQGLDRRMAAYAGFKDHLIRLTGDLRADEYLRGLTIHQATGIGIDLAPGDETAPFLPTLYGDRPGDATTADQEDQGSRPEPDREADREPLLPQHHAKQFQKRFLDQGARSHFTLGGGVYTVLDAPVAAALQVLERVNRADPSTSQAFRQDPLAFLRPAIEEAGGDCGVICDLRGYGERVIGVGDWVPPSFSFALAVSRDWFPAEEVEIFTIRIPDEVDLVIPAEEVTALKELMTQAQASGATVCDFNGRSLSLTDDLVRAIQGLSGRMAPGPRASTEEGGALPEPKGAAITRDNEELLTFLAEQRRQRGHFTPGLPRSLSTVPMPHQESGLGWLQAGYLAGAPGLLLADDMGVGKTYQVLAFLRWLREQEPAGRRPGLGPFLVVAPKTLLGNWREEIGLHLGANALGRELHAYERGLRDLKLHTGGGNDTTLRRQTLDVAAIESADLVLTTYETLRDYHFSFGKVRFAVIVYDEAQKLKNPASLMNRGAKAQQGGFTLLMTGTPIENSVGDLWTLLDIAWPGFLGLSLREFLSRHRGDDPERSEELKRRLIEPTIDQVTPIPAIMLRRFKHDILEGLPERRVEATQDPMPPEQQNAYDAVRTAIRERPQGTLEGLQQLRAISLHPRLGQPPESAAQDGPFIAASARFKRLFVILDLVHERGEKALIFVELREAQRALYDLIRRRYSLPSPLPETINGATAGPVRDRIRHAFQDRRGFDVLILGPKAAGFGLTLTAANHVIHLNRWWNPAVEDQCSDRVYRIGQTKPVTIYLPQAIHPGLGEGSFDSLLHGLLEEKRCLSREIVVPVQFSDQDFRALFEKSLGEAQPHPPVADHIDGMDWRGFELWVADELKRVGLSVEVTRGQGDGGVDIIGTAREGGRPVFVQCKHAGKGTEARIDEGAVRDLMRARDAHRHTYPDPILGAATNGRFSLAAENLALELGVALFDSPRLPTLGPVLFGLSRGSVR